MDWWSQWHIMAIVSYQRRVTTTYMMTVGSRSWEVGATVNSLVVTLFHAIITRTGTDLIFLSRLGSTICFTNFGSHDPIVLYWNPWYTVPCYKGSLLYFYILKYPLSSPWSACIPVNRRKRGTFLHTSAGRWRHPGCLGTCGREQHGRNGPWRCNVTAGCPWQRSPPATHINPSSYSNYIKKYKNVFAPFLSFLNSDMAQVVEILPCERQGPGYPIYSITWLLMSWQRKEPGQQQPWYWPASPRIFWSQYQRG